MWGGNGGSVGAPVLGMHSAGLSIMELMPRKGPFRTLNDMKESFMAIPHHHWSTRRHHCPSAPRFTRLCQSTTSPDQLDGALVDHDRNVVILIYFGFSGRT